MRHLIRTRGYYVEELTRYIIDLQKQIDELKKGKEVKE